MSEVQIQTPRGALLSGTFVDPVDSTDAAVVFSHSIFDDRNSSLHFNRLAAMYRNMGYATLKFDLSGHGLSEDEEITLPNHVEDLQSVSGWLADQGFVRQIIHAHSFGTLPAMKAAPYHAKSMILSSAVLGPLDYDWEDVFSSSQLEELERRGTTEVPDDSAGPRESFVVSKESLAGLSLNDPEDLLRNVRIPVLIIEDADDIQRGLLDLAQEAAYLLPDGSSIEAVWDASFGQGQQLERLSDIAGTWAAKHVPVRSGTS